MDAVIDYDVTRIKQDFPILNQQVHGHPLAYLDNAATTQKPNCVLKAIDYYYQHDNSNVHRGVHALSERATKSYEAARHKVQEFVNAKHVEEIIFVRGTTEAINLVANSYGRSNLNAGDSVLISTLEHHSNIIPWQMVCEQTGASLKVIPINDAGEINLEAFEKLLTDEVKILAVGHASNAIGTVNPIKFMINKAHEKNIPVLIDGAQAAPHIAIDVQDLDCDFYALSGHKMYGPTGIGILYGKKALLETMLPYQGGGEMISRVTFEKSTYNKIPHKFEAGTPNIAGAIGLHAAIDYLQSVGLDNIAEHEHELLIYATEAMSSIPELRIIGTAKEKIGVVSFILGDIHAHDVGTILDHHGVAIRAGHHCAMPLMDRFEVPATVRASFGLYNTREEIDRLVDALNDVRRMFA